MVFPERALGEIFLFVCRDENQVHIKYQDNGQGIAKQHLAHIYEPFFTTRRAEGGSGLGLYTVYNTVTHQLKGKIDCQSSKIDGTVFTITFPNGL